MRGDDTTEITVHARQRLHHERDIDAKGRRPNVGGAKHKIPPPLKYSERATLDSGADALCGQRARAVRQDRIPERDECTSTLKHLPQDPESFRRADRARVPLAQKLPLAICVVKEGTASNSSRTYEMGLRICKVRRLLPNFRNLCVRLRGGGPG